MKAGGYINGHYNLPMPGGATSDGITTTSPSLISDPSSQEPNGPARLASSACQRWASRIRRLGPPQRRAARSALELSEPGRGPISSATSSVAASSRAWPTTPCGW